MTSKVAPFPKLVVTPVMLEKVTAWPLMLLKGTPLFQEKEKWNLKEEILNDFDIPVVISSNSFNKDDWYKMKEIADSLNSNQRF